MKHFKAICLIVIICAFLVSTAITQEIPLLVKVQPINQNLEAFIRVHKIPIYLKTDNYTLLELEKINLASLERQGYSYQIVDTNPTNYEYFFLSLPTGREDLSRWGQVLFRDSDGVFIKTTMAELRAVPMTDWKVVKARRVIPLSSSSYQLSTALNFDPFIQSLVDQVSLDSIRTTIQNLQDFKTRYSFTPHCSLAADYLIDRFQKYGLKVEADWYDNGGYQQRNIVAMKSGTNNPKKEFIIGAHYDSHSRLDPWHNAPGADDNASGTAAVVECARILSQYDFDCTFKFIAFCGEEQWMIGSGHYAANAAATGQDIAAMINNDMIAYTSEGDQEDLEIISDYASEWLADVWVAVAQTYTKLLVTKTIDPNAPSDHEPFWDYGFCAIECAEDEAEEIWGGSNPNYHSAGDTLGTLNLNFAAETVKIDVAGLASLQLLLLPVSDLQVAEPGTGTELILSWNRLEDVRTAGYRLYYGTTSRNYTFNVDVGNVTQYVVSGLQEGTNYFFAVAACDTAGREGVLSLEVSATPESIPRAPANLLATPKHFSIRLEWDANWELDLLGYNIYRRAAVQEWSRINLKPVFQESYVDSPFTETTHYWYAVTAVDSSLNESLYSNEVEMVPALLNQGILVVDETRDGNGSLLNPTDEQVDEFYRILLSGYNYSEWDVKTKGLPQLDDVLLFSTVIWHNDDINDLQFNQGKEIFQLYLGAGGNLWVTGWRILSPGEFLPGTMEFDYFHVAGVKEKPAMDFIGASGALDYPEINVDTSKIIQSWGEKLPFGIILKPYKGETIFRFRSATADPEFNNQCCGLRYLGEDYKFIVTGFPLYFMNTEQASTIVHKVLNDFNEPTEVKEISDGADYVIPTQFALSQNYPNPFNLTTNIFYQLPKPAIVNLSVYNIYGQLLKTLVNGKRTPGSYSVEWDANGISSGIYFIRLNIEQFSETKKCILLK